MYIYRHHATRVNPGNCVHALFLCFSERTSCCPNLTSESILVTSPRRSVAPGQTRDPIPATETSKSSTWKNIKWCVSCMFEKWCELYVMKILPKKGCGVSCML